MRVISWLSMFALLACSAIPITAHAEAALDGKTFVVEVRDGKQVQSDDLIFKAGTFRSVDCDQYGFTETGYTTTVEGGVVRFDATAHSRKSGTMTWKGKVNGDAIEGTAVWDPAWWRPNRTFAFSGTAKQ